MESNNLQQPDKPPARTKPTSFFGWALALWLALVAAWLGWDYWQQSNANRWEKAPVGFSSQVYVDQSGKKFPLVLYRPHENLDNPRPGVILFLNGFGENGDDGVSQLSNNFGGEIWALRGRFPMFVLAPQMSQGSEWTRNDSDVAEAAIEMVQLVVERCGVDPDRVYVTGPSSGGAGTSALPTRFPGVFAAMAPVSTGVLSRADDLPAWTLLNGGDKEHLVEEADRSFAKRLADGVSPQRTVYNQGGHNAWSNAYNDPALYDWLSRHQRRVSSEFPARYQLINLDSLTSLGIVVNASQNTLVHKQDLPHGDLLLVPPSDHLHFEYYSKQNVPCRVFAWSLDEGSRPTDANRVAEIDLRWPDCGSSKLKIGDSTSYGLAVAERAMQSSRWNDVRVERDSNLVTVYLNGWKLIEHKLDQNSGLPEKKSLHWGLRLEQLPEGQEQQFRHLRVLNQPTASTKEKASNQNSDIAEHSKFRLVDSSESSDQSLDQPPLQPATAISLTIDEILNQWKHWEEQHDKMEISWKRVDQIPLITWLNAESSKGELEFLEQSLKLDGSRIHLESARPYVTAQIRPEYIAREVGVYFPERGRSNFLGHLYSRFKPPAPPINIHPFVRSCDSTKLLDWWQPSIQALSRAHLRPLPKPNSAQAALLQFEQHPNDRCASLEMSSALMALRPLSCPLHPLDQQQLAIETTVEGVTRIDVGGVDCVRLVDQTTDAQYRRQWLVASRSPHQVVRYIAEAGSQGVQLDIDWNGDAQSLQPSGWRYQLFHTNGVPTQYFGAAQTVQWQPATKPLKLQMDVEKLPAGTWVVEEGTRPPVTYLTKANGQRRRITDSELAWLPKHEELLCTESGQVSSLIQRKIFWRQLWSGQIWPANLLGLLAILLSGWLLHRFKNRYRDS